MAASDLLRDNEDAAADDNAVLEDDANLLDSRIRSMNMISAEEDPSPYVLKTNHLDYIHDLAFDTYGRRMASCSGDRFVKIWDMRGAVSVSATGAAPEGQQQLQQQPQVRDSWTCSAAWQAHRGSVTCLSWCHPEYGTLLATAGLDQEVKIWEERNTTSIIAAGSNGGSIGGGVPSPPGGGAGNNGSSSSSTSSLWTLRASLTEAKRAVTSVAFAPRHYGLKLASASCDGSVRIYEAIDVVNVGSWPLSATLQAYGTSNADNDDDDDDDAGDRQRSNRRGTDPRAASSSSASSSPSSHWLTLSWCTGRFDPPTLVVGGGTNPTEAAIATATSSSGGGGGGTVNAILIYRYMDAARSWLPMRILPRIAPPATSLSNPSSVLASSPALCVAWAPNVGRRYHYVAAAYGNGLVVYKLKRGGIGGGGGGGGPSNAAATTSAGAPPSQGSGSGSNSTSTATNDTDLELESTQVLPVSSAWRCQWNVTGTVLACSGDHGAVHMYKVSPHSGKFDLVSEIRHNIHDGGQE